MESVGLVRISDRDYDLWLRLLEASEPTGRVRFANLPWPLLLLRKHSANVSSTRRAEQTKASDQAASRAMTRFLGRPIDLELAKAVRSPETATSEGHLMQAVEVMLELEKRMTVEGLEPGEDRRVGVMMVREDVTGRIRAAGATAIANFGPGMATLEIVRMAAKRTAVPKRQLALAP